LQCTSAPIVPTIGAAQASAVLDPAPPALVAPDGARVVARGAADEIAASGSSNGSRRPRGTHPQGTV